jgi:hypothetical protein
VRSESSPAADAGNAFHSYAAALLAGAADALDRVPEEHREACAQHDRGDLAEAIMDASGALGGSPIPEVALHWFAPGNARVLAENSPGRSVYSGVTGGYVGTADVLCRSDDMVTVLDWKTGRTPVPPPARNWQLRGLAVAACRAYGVERARVAVATVRDGSITVESATLDALDLDADEAALTALVAQAANPATEYREGDHCRYCPAQAACPAKAGAMRQALALRPEESLSAERMGELWLALGAAEERLEQLRKELTAEVKRRGSLPLPGGRTLRWEEQSRESLDAGVVARVLAGLHGEQVARSALELSTSKAAVKRAVAALVTPEKKLAALAREAEEAIRAAGGVKVSTYGKAVER